MGAGLAPCHAPSPPTVPCCTSFPGPCLGMVVCGDGGAPGGGPWNGCTCTAVAMTPADDQPPVLPTVQALWRPAQLLGPSVNHQVPQQQPPGASARTGHGHWAVAPLLLAITWTPAATSNPGFSNWPVPLLLSQLRLSCSVGMNLAGHGPDHVAREQFCVCACPCAARRCMQW